ncbi:MAG: hypothetical protein U0800_14075 [Isosphaeraceae bacterium]
MGPDRSPFQFDLVAALFGGRRPDQSDRLLVGAAGIALAATTSLTSAAGPYAGGALSVVADFRNREQGPQVDRSAALFLDPRRRKAGLVDDARIHLLEREQWLDRPLDEVFASPRRRPQPRSDHAPGWASHVLTPTLIESWEPPTGSSPDPRPYRPCTTRTRSRRSMAAPASATPSGTGCWPGRSAS